MKPALLPAFPVGRWSRFALLVCLCGGSAVEARTWTNLEGREIEAGFISSDEDSVLLEIKGKEVDYPLAKLSQADRDWIAGQKEKAAAEVAAKTGRFEKAPIHAMLFPEDRDYFKDSVRKNVLAAFEGGAFDDSNKGKAEDWLKRDPAADTCTLYVPKSYDGTEPFGVYLHIHSAEKALIKPEWQPLFDELKVIAVCADGAGNKTAMIRRVRLSIDALATVGKDYKIDPERRVVGGNSGGGHMAMLTAAMFPEMFIGAVSAVAQSYLPGHFPGMDTGDFTRGKRKEMKWIVVSGDKDKNYQEILKTSEVWEDLKMDYRFLDIPGTRHGPLSVDALKEALKWVGM